MTFSNLCRTCLSEGKMQSLFDKICINSTESSASSEYCLSDMVMECTSVKIEKMENLPSLICVNCIYHLKQSFAFKKQCESVDTILRLHVDKQGPHDTTDGQHLTDVSAILDEEITTESSTSDDKFEHISTNSIRDLDLKNNQSDTEKDEKHSCDEKESDNEEETILPGKNKHPVQCAKCNGVFSLKSFVRHKRTAHGNTKNQCDECGKCFKVNALLLRHVRIHTGEKPYPCEICDRKFSNAFNLKRHVKIHTGDKPHVCEICNKAFIQRVTLAEHLLTHANKFPLVCKVCGKTYRRTARLRAHACRRVGKSERPEGGASETCPICDRVLSSKQILKLHLKTHGEKSYLCTVCGKKFVFKRNLQQHSNIHTGNRPYQCNVCGKSFAQSCTLKIHSYVHTGEKKYSCRLCGKAFKQSQHVVYHMRTHTGEKPYRCSVCDKSFSGKNTLTVHTRTHTGEKPYKCIVCCKGFISSNNMKTHMRRHRN